MGSESALSLNTPRSPLFSLPPSLPATACLDRGPVRAPRAEAVGIEAAVLAELTALWGGEGGGSEGHVQQDKVRRCTARAIEDEQVIMGMAVWPYGVGAVGGRHPQIYRSTHHARTSSEVVQFAMIVLGLISRPAGGRGAAYS